MSPNFIPPIVDQSYYGSVFINQLLQPFDPYFPHKAVAQIKAPGSILTLRPFCANTDMDFASKWIEDEYSLTLKSKDKRSRERYLRLTNIYNLRSSDRQVFLCLKDETPVCQVEICKASHDLNCMGHCSAGDWGDGDYSVQLIPSLEMSHSRDLFVNAVKLCLQYFFSFCEVKRILTLSVSEAPPDNWLTGAGFKKIKTLKLQGGRAYLYACSQDRF